MSQPLLKPRWKTWETKCIQRAYKERIQQKVVSMALGRSVISISKKIKNLGLKPLSTASASTKEDNLPVKGNQKVILNFQKMKNILKKYAPLNVFLRAELTLKEECWTSPPSPPLKGLKRGPCIGRTEKKNASFSMLMPLDYIVSRDQIPLGKQTHLKEPLCVPLYHMEMWAIGEGFQQTKEALREQGLSYWKDGRYFSQAQLLMHINQIRHEKKLQPLILLENEETSKS